MSFKTFLLLFGPFSTSDYSYSDFELKEAKESFEIFEFPLLSF